MVLDTIRHLSIRAAVTDHPLCYWLVGRPREEIRRVFVLAVQIAAAGGLCIDNAATFGSSVDWFVPSVGVGGITKRSLSSERIKVASPSPPSAAIPPAAATLRSLRRVTRRICGVSSCSLRSSKMVSLSPLPTIRGFRGVLGRRGLGSATFLIGARIVLTSATLGSRGASL